MLPGKDPQAGMSSLPIVKHFDIFSDLFYRFLPGAIFGVGFSSLGIGYTVGSDIARIPVYGSEQTITDWWAGTWWDLFGDSQ